MNTKHLGTLLLALSLAAGAPALRAQTAPPPQPPPPEQPQPYSTADENSLWQVDITAPYSFRWHTAGIVGDVGGDWEGNFIGGELSYYNAREDDYAWYLNGNYAGKVPYREHIETANLAYRYSFPLPFPGMISTAPSPLRAYLGASAGVGFIQYYPGYYTSAATPFAGGPDYSDKNEGRFDYDLVGGLQWTFTPAFGLKVGYRFIELVSAHRFYDQQTNIDSGALEAGLILRF